MYRSPINTLTISSLLSIFFVGMLSSNAFASTSHANSTHFCQCVEFVNDFTGVGINANADDWHNYLPGKGYLTTSTPEAGEIVTYPAGVDGASTFGHVAIIDAISSIHGSTYTLHLLGANQGNSGWFTYSTCNNVNFIYMNSTLGDGSQYWYQPSNPDVVSQ